jgi:hypothetical protein
MNTRGNPHTLVPRHMGNVNAVRSGVYSERIRVERTQGRLDELRKLPHVLPDDHPLLEAIARQLALLELIDEDIERRGLSDRHGRVRSIVELRDRAVGRLQKLLQEAEATPAARRKLEAETDRRALAVDISHLAEDAGPGVGVGAALRLIAFRPESTLAEKLRALELLSTRADRKARLELQDSAITLRALG